MSADEFAREYTSGVIYVAKYLVSRLGMQPWAAREVAHDAWAHAWSVRAQWQGRASLRTWVARIARNAVWDTWRKSRNAPVVVSIDCMMHEDEVDPALTVNGTHERTARRILWERVMARLSPRDAAYVHLRYRDGMTVTEMARALGRSWPGVHSEMHRVNLRLAEIGGTDG